jgi:hypothetical protein
MSGGLGREPEAAAQVRKLGRPGVPASFLLADKAVQDELELSAEQVRKARAAYEKDRDARERIESGPAGEANKLWREVLAESEKAVAAILSPSQLKRFQQIRLQQVGALALADPKLADELKLTEDQRKAIKVIVEGRAAKARAAVDDSTLAEREVAAKITEITTAADAAVRKVLTVDQKAKWEELIGKPFRWPSP